MFKKTALIAGISLALSTTAQADYRWEADASAGLTNWDYGSDDGDVNAFGIGGSFFLESVNTSKGPLGEAAFLDHSSNISLNYVYTDADDIVDNLDGDQYRINGRYVIDADIPLIFEGSYQRDEPNDAEVDTYTLGIGAYVTDNTSLVVTYADADVDDGGDTDGWQLDLEHMWTWEDGGFKLGGNAGYVNVDDGDDIDIYNIAATWYITNNLGLGVSTGYTDFSSQEFLSTDISIEWFITENIALSALVGYAESDDSIRFLSDEADLERTRGAIGLTMRF
jgi:hypothetical protein